MHPSPLPPARKSKDLTLTQLNCLGLLSTLDNIHERTIFEINCDILCLWEMWLQPDTIRASHLFMANFSSFPRDRHHGKHGGL